MTLDNNDEAQVSRLKCDAKDRVRRSQAQREQILAEFDRFMRQYEKFCQVKVLNDFLMSNHFHLLVEVPDRPAEDLSEDAIC